MISDILHDAGAEIRHYLDDIPAAYADTRDDILALLADMDRIRAKLDAPASTAPAPARAVHIHPEPDADYRKRLLEVADDRDRPEIEIAGPYALDAFGLKYHRRRKPGVGPSGRSIGWPGAHLGMDGKFY